jgi:TPR repeat protein
VIPVIFRVSYKFNAIGLNVDQAAFWYRKAAEKRGNAAVQENLTNLGINWKKT